MKYILTTLVIAAAIFVIVGLRRALRTYLKFRGKRLVSCPETHKPAAVRVAAEKVALKATVGNELLTLSECSRWPEREACGQECLAQIQEAPKACLVWTIINRWYQGQNCVYCHKPFGEIHWHEHPPALLNKERKTVQWNEIPAEKLQEALETHRPVCWNCHIAQTFRREHPELVVDHEQRGEFAEMKEWASYANLFCKTQICGASRTTSSSWGFQQRRFWKPLTSGTPI